MKNLKLIDRDQAAALIRGYARVCKITQSKISHELKIPKSFLSLFLNRKIDLLPQQISEIFSFLGIQDKLSLLIHGESKE